MARGKRDEKEKKERARKDRKVERIVKEEVKPAKDVTPCPVCDGLGKPGPRGCPLCGVIS